MVFSWSHRPALVRYGRGPHEGTNTRRQSPLATTTFVFKFVRRKEISSEMCSCVFIREEKLLESPPGGIPSGPRFVSHASAQLQEKLGGWAPWEAAGARGGEEEVVVG